MRTARLTSASTSHCSIPQGSRSTTRSPIRRASLSSRSLDRRCIESVRRRSLDAALWATGYAQGGGTSGSADTRSTFKTAIERDSDAAPEVRGDRRRNKLPDGYRLKQTSDSGWTSRDALPPLTTVHYPDEFSYVDTEGGIVGQFIVDTTGKARRESWRTLASTHREFGDRCESDPSGDGSRPECMDNPCAS